MKCKVKVVWQEAVNHYEDAVVEVDPDADPDVEIEDFLSDAINDMPTVPPVSGLQALAGVSCVEADRKVAHRMSLCFGRGGKP